MPDPYYTSLLRARVDFDQPLQAWDGFGLNYVQTCHTADFARDAQDYGGFDTLSDEAVEEILDLLFGPDGPRAGLLKMFCDPHHCAEPADGSVPEPLGPLFDHTTTTRSMRRFVQGGLRRTRAWGGDLSILTTLYGPPGWMTLQRAFRGRDLDPAREEHLLAYYVSWARHLKEREKLPLRFVSLHNEGECWRRWTPEGHDLPALSGHDYNMFWSPEQVAAFIPRLRRALDAAGLPEVGVTNGETFSWLRFSGWGYAQALVDSPEAMRDLALVTSHAFYSPYPKRWAGDHYSAGFDRVKARRPELKAWSTSASWGKMDAAAIWDFHNQITHAKVSAIIPWACCQRSQLWAGGDPNPGTAIRVHGDGTWSVEPGYHFYKTIARAGQPGMRVCTSSCNEGGLYVTAFSGRGTDHPDALVVTNATEFAWPLPVELRGGRHEAYHAFLTSPTDRFRALGKLPVVAGRVVVEVPSGGVVGLYGA